MSVAPCVFPRCRDLDGNPRLTEDTICEPCRRRYARTLTWLREDFEYLARELPKPVGGRSGRGARRVSFGHPAAWASDLKALIAAVFNEVEDELRERAGHGAAPGKWVSEAARVQHAYDYLRLDARIAELCEGDGAADIAADFADLHNKIRRQLGLTRQIQRLPVPCPGAGCQALGLYREVGRVWCEICGMTFTDDQYHRLALIVAGDVVSALDPDERITAAQAAAECGTSVSTVRKWRQRGHLKAAAYEVRNGREVPVYRRGDVQDADLATRLRATGHRPVDMAG